MRERFARLGLATLGCAIALGAVAAPSALPSAAPRAPASYVEATELNPDPEADDPFGSGAAKFEKARCRTSKLGFLAKAKSVSGNFVMALQLIDFKGFDKKYKIFYGSYDRSLTVEGVGAAEGSANDWDSIYNPPGVPPGTRSGGGVSFSNKGKFVSVGFTPMYNADYSRAVSVLPKGGGLRCDYKK